MRYAVTLELKSPALVGDRREPSAYFLPSRDFIPGGVLRAALARVITEGCPYYSEARGYHWVRFAAGSECADCMWCGLCASFERVRFSHLYKDSARVAPLTAYRCKFDSSHSTFDTLLAPGRLRCPECKERVERVSGYLDNEYRDVAVNRRLIMRLAVDPYRGVAQDRQLYALRVLDAGQTFLGWLDVPDADTIPETVELRLGAKTTVGLGRAAVRFERAAGLGLDALKKRIERFQEVIRQSAKAEPGYTCFSITLLSEALPDTELTPATGWVSTPDLRQEVAQAVLPPPLRSAGPGVEVTRAVADFKVYGGYSTAVKGDGRQKARLYIAAGSVFLCRVRGELNDGLLQALFHLEKQGVGLKTEDGYGALCVCDEFHLNNGGVSDEG
ncbi:CRISPR-associated protein Csx10 [Desulfofundulus luciae]|uniref:CRISPR-associated protein Csx10 n=1 Tax=Desulfofundulus luciae TaxID=74702 RepID=A0ABU0AYJ2_9FIRM|nr:hypothetical protein [Desulfofundulus luciae]MDQ0285537.1 CRISPR-associated protein Csx10 [Desulfofundulus luciae]